MKYTIFILAILLSGCDTLGAAVYAYGQGRYASPRPYYGPIQKPTIFCRNVLGGVECQ